MSVVCRTHSLRTQQQYLTHLIISWELRMKSNKMERMWQWGLILTMFMHLCLYVGSVANKFKDMNEWTLKVLSLLLFGFTFTERLYFSQTVYFELFFFYQRKKKWRNTWNISFTMKFFIYYKWFISASLFLANS